MTAVTILMHDQVCAAIDDAGPDNYFGLSRAIEQAVLQSPEIQALRKDAELYRTLRKMRWNDSPLCVVRNPKESVRLGSDCPSDERLDLMILAAMEQQT